MSDLETKQELQLKGREKTFLRGLKPLLFDWGILRDVLWVSRHLPADSSRGLGQQEALFREPGLLQRGAQDPCGRHQRSVGHWFKSRQCHTALIMQMRNVLRLQKMCFITLFASLEPELRYLNMIRSYWRDYILKSWLHPSADNVCNCANGERNAYNFLSFQFLWAVVPAIWSEDRVECVQTMKAQTNQPRWQLFLMQSLWIFLLS